MKKSTVFFSVCLLVLVVISFGGCITYNGPRPKLVEDFVILNKPGTRLTAFVSDEARALPGDTQYVWAKIDPNNTLITKVAVEWGDSPHGEEAWFDLTENADPQLSDQLFDGNIENYRTYPGKWSASLPIRNNMVEGSIINYQFRVFYKPNASASERSEWLGKRSLVLGPVNYIEYDHTYANAFTNLEPRNLTIPEGQVGSANLRLSKIPTAPVTVRFYTDPEGALQVINEQGQPYDSVLFNRDEFVKTIQIKAIRPGVLWAKASGWRHGSVQVTFT